MKKILLVVVQGEGKRIINEKKKERKYVEDDKRKGMIKGGYK